MQHGNRRNTKLNKDMIKWITSSDTVMKQTGMTLAQRAVQFNMSFPMVKITEQKLGKVYKKYHIRRKSVMIKKFSNLKKAQKIKEQIDRCRDQLKYRLDKDHTIYYIDECMFTVKTYLTTDWSPKG